MTDIFLSYAKEDRSKAGTFSQAMEAQGWNVFWDKVIPTGMTWREVIGSRLHEAKCIVVLWSRSSVISHWVLEEAEIGLQRGILIPVLIEDVPPPLGFQSLQAADLSKWDGNPSAATIKNLGKDIETIIGSPTVPVQKQEEFEVERKGKAEEEGGSLAEVEMKGEPEPVVQPDSVLAEVVSRSLTSAESKLKTILFVNRMPLLLWLSIAIYTGFAILLLSGGSDDTIAGYIFLGNALILIIGSSVSYFGTVRASKICSLGAIVQIVILVGMLSLSVGEAGIVISLNLCVAGAFVGMMALYRRQERKQSPPNESFQRTAKRRR
jgi:hypothetical protein